MNKFNSYIIRFWLVMGIAALIYSIYRILTTGWQEGSPNLIPVAIIFAWYYARKKTTERWERNQQKDNNGKS